MNNPVFTHTRPRQPEDRIPQLDGWRAGAAVSIVVGHFFGNAHMHFTRNTPMLFDFLSFIGHLGLQALFIISGYIICRLLLIEEQRYGSFSFRGFYIRRFVRVLPPFYIYLATIAALAYFGLVTMTWKQLAKAFFLVVDFHSHAAPWLTGHVWSLSVEEQFYLFFPAILWLTPLRWRGRTFAIICIGFIISAIALAATTRVFALSSGVVTGFVGIFWGVLLSLHEDRVRRFVQDISRKIFFLMALILLLISVACMDGWRLAVYQTMLLPPAIGLFMMSTVEQETWFSSLICWPPLRLIGITSYALYLWQQLFTGTSNVYLGAGHYIPYCLPALFLIVPISWVVLEKRSIGWGKTLSSRVRKAAPAKLPQPVPISASMPGSETASSPASYETATVATR